MNLTRLERLQQLDYRIVQKFAKDRVSASIPEDLQEYILMMNSTASIIHHKGSSQTRVCKALQLEYPQLSYSQARDIYYDALNFFYIDDSISAESWDNYYADKMEDLARLSIAMNKPDAALKAMSKAHELRITSRNIVKPGDWTPPVFFISPKLSEKDLGFEKKDVFEIQRRNEDRLLAGIINDLPTSQKEKNRLLIEANVKDIEIDKKEFEDNGE